MASTFPITKRQFRAWLASKPPKSKPCPRGFCPLEQAVKEIIGENIVVTPHLWCSSQHEWWQNSSRNSLPRWAKAFVPEIDRRSNWSWYRLTAQQIAEVLG